MESNFFWSWNYFGTVFPSLVSFPWLCNSLGVYYLKQQVSRCYILRIKAVRRCVKTSPIGNVWEPNFVWSWNYFGTCFSCLVIFPWNCNSLGVYHFKQQVFRCSSHGVTTRAKSVQKAKSRRIVFTRCSLALRARSRSVRFANRARSLRQKYLRCFFEIPVKNRENNWAAWFAICLCRNSLNLLNFFPKSAAYSQFKSTNSLIKLIKARVPAPAHPAAHASECALFTLSSMLLKNYEWPN